MKKICIMGCGGVGGYFGGLMAYHNTNSDIYFIARGDHLQQIRQNGLILNKDGKKSLVCRPTLATDDVGLLPECNLVIVAVKGYDLSEALTLLQTVINRDTVLLPLLNGMDIYERVRSRFSKAIVLPACVYVGTHIEKPGVVTQEGGDGRIVFGRDPENNGYDISLLTGLLDDSKIDYLFQEDPFPAIWTKYMFIAAFGMVTACYAKSLGEVLELEHLKGLARGIMQEIYAIAQEKKILLPDDIIDRLIEKGHEFPYDTRTSYQRDIETPGKKDEGELFGGTIIALGEKTGIRTPVTEQLYKKIYTSGLT